MILRKCKPLGLLVPTLPKPEMGAGGGGDDEGYEVRHPLFNCNINIYCRARRSNVRFNTTTFSSFSLPLPSRFLLRRAPPSSSP